MTLLPLIENQKLGQVHLGMTREEVYKELKQEGDPAAKEEWLGDYHLEYRKGKVVFIERPNPFSADTIVLFKDVDVFKTEASLLIKYISDFGAYDDTDSEIGYSYRFPTLGIGFWRSSLFEYSMLNSEDFKDMPLCDQLEELRYLYFESVCVFTPDYYETA